MAIRPLQDPLLNPGGACGRTLPKAPFPAHPPRRCLRRQGALAATLRTCHAMRSRLSVSSSVLHPMRADASAASQPACPAPTTTTSYASSASHSPPLLLDARASAAAAKCRWEQCRSDNCCPGAGTHGWRGWPTKPRAAGHCRQAQQQVHQHQLHCDTFAHSIRVQGGHPPHRHCLQSMVAFCSCRY